MIVRLCGGLCNTLFQYALGRALSAKGIQVDFLWKDRNEPYTLSPYNVEANLVTSIYNPPIYREQTFAFDPDVFKQKQGTYIDGVWQTERYFLPIAEQIRSELTLKEIRPEVEAIAERLREVPSVFVHVRRGDNLSAKSDAYHGNVGLSYYTAAMDYIGKQVEAPQFFIFSDDPAWCEGKFTDEVISAKGFNRYEDLYLMSQCRHAVIANSTYSWWGAWLGEYPGKIVVAPQQWFRGAGLDETDIVPERWVRMPSDWVENGI